MAVRPESLLKEVLTGLLEINPETLKSGKVRPIKKNSTHGTSETIPSTILRTPKSEENSIYLNNLKLQLKEPLSPSTVGLLGIASVMQWLPGPVSQAGRAAFIESGGQHLQDCISAFYESKATALTQPIIEPIKPELGAGYLLYKTITTQSINVPYHNYNLNATPNSVAINAKWEIK